MVPSFFQAIKYQYTMRQGGRSCGSAHPRVELALAHREEHPGAQGVGASCASPHGKLAGRPPGFGAGMKRETWAHSAGVRSDG